VRVKLRTETVPPEVGYLLPLAERWGIGDDFEREAAVRDASRSDLVALVHAADDAPDALWDWLAGAESHSAHPSPEYLAVTCMTMAADAARVKLRGA
jgi:hypothetical protein